jgi:predicted MFS family arabinose efflux permease
MVGRSWDRGLTVGCRFLSPKRKIQTGLLLPAIILAVFATTILDVSAPLLLTDIAKTFQIQVGIASSIRSSSSIAGVIFGLLIAVLSIRFKHKSLLLFGLTCEFIASIIAFLSPTLDILRLAHFLDGVGSVIVLAMAYSLVGDFYPPEKRGKPIGGIVAAGSLGFIVGAPLIGLISSFGDWRVVMLWFALPISLVSLVFSKIAIQSKQPEPETPSEPVLPGLKQILSNISILACLIGIMFFASAGAMSVYLVSFWKHQFAITTSMASLTILVNSSVGVVAGLVAGRLLNRTGRKILLITGGLVESVLIILMMVMPTFALSWGVRTARILCFSFASTAFAGLNLEQTSNFRGTMMSLSGAFSSLGSLIGITIGGLALNAYSYEATGFVLGASGIVSVIVVAMLAKDPKKIVTIPSIIPRQEHLNLPKQPIQANYTSSERPEK